MLKRVVNRLLYAKTVSRPFKPFFNRSFLMERLLVKKSGNGFQWSKRDGKTNGNGLDQKKTRPWLHSYNQVNQPM